MHVHAGVLDATIFAAYLLIVGFILRWIETRYPDSFLGKALAFIY
jgi:hypothetical protein